MCIFVVAVVFFLFCFSFSLLHPNMGWVCCWLSSLSREIFSGRSSSSENVVEEEPVGRYATTKRIFIPHLHLYFLLNISHYSTKYLATRRLSLSENSDFILVEILRRELFSVHVYAEGNSQGSLFINRIKFTKSTSSSN